MKCFASLFEERWSSSARTLSSSLQRHIDSCDETAMNQWSEEIITERLKTLDPPSPISIPRT